MNATFGSHSSSGSSHQDFELNLASIIDCFTVLIAFMLASASFLSIGILDAGVAAAGAVAANETPPPVQLSIELRRDHSILIKTSGKSSSSSTVGQSQGTWDTERLRPADHWQRYRCRRPGAGGCAVGAAG